uniref:Transcription factor CBF/NF-Y/archaeal histone domain-containing protein n=1 Tax=Panagrolaimus superbus TaxID=310955 RepID=A0A914ZDT4_9BILA
MDPYGASSSSSSSNDLPGRIRKRRYSTARIQPTRIKKVMQSDEDIGRMVSSVPVAIGSAMEHFCEKLLENAQDVMHKSASKTLAPAHIFTAINRTEYLKSFLEPVINNFGGGATSSSPVTTPTNGLIGKPFENLSSILSPMEERFDLNQIMRDTAKSHLASNIAAGASTSDEGKRRRGRPKKDEKEKPKAIITILSPPNGQDFLSSSSTVSLNGISTKADLDRVLMPPPLLVPQRKIQPQKVIIPKTLISNNITSSSSPNNTSSSTTTQSSTTMVSSNSTDQISA